MSSEREATHVAAVPGAPGALVADGASRREVVRLPLQIGANANRSIALAAIPLFVGGLLLVAMALRIDHLLEGLSEPAPLVWWFGLTSYGVLCSIYGGVQIARAIRVRPSDILFDQAGVYVDGGPRGGKRIGWDELSEPFAAVEEKSEERLAILLILVCVPVFILSIPLAVALKTPPFIVPPVRTVTFWRLLLYVEGRAVTIAETEEQSEADSLKAAASSIAAVKAGREHIEQAATVPVHVIECPACNAPAVPADAEVIPCAYCGASIPLSGEARERAAAAAALQKSRNRLAKTVARLLEQPRAARANARLLPLALERGRRRRRRADLGGDRGGGASRRSRGLVPRPAGTSVQRGSLRSLPVALRSSRGSRRDRRRSAIHLPGPM